MRLVGTTHRWIGRSTEVKPYVDLWDFDAGATLTANDVPAGSLFYEEDTGWEFIYRGGRWELAPDSGRTAIIIAKLDDLVVAIRENVTETKRLNGHLTIGSDLESEESLEVAMG